MKLPGSPTSPSCSQPLDLEVFVTIPTASGSGVCMPRTDPPLQWLAKLTSSWTPSCLPLGSWHPRKEGLPLLSSHPTLQARVSSLATADSDASTTLVSLLTLHVHTPSWLSAQGGPSRASCGRTPRVELLTQQLFSRFSGPHLKTCYFWRE